MVKYLQIAALCVLNVVFFKFLFLCGLKLIGYFQHFPRGSARVIAQTFVLKYYKRGKADERQ